MLFKPWQNEICVNRRRARLVAFVVVSCVDGSIQSGGSPDPSVLSVCSGSHVPFTGEEEGANLLEHALG